jgi:hypothetical protein
VNASIFAFSTKSAINHIGLSSNLFPTPGGLGRPARIFAVVNFEMSTITGPPSPRSGKLKAETVVRARVCPEDSAIKKSLVGIVGVNDKLGLLSSL